MQFSQIQPPWPWITNFDLPDSPEQKEHFKSMPSSNGSIATKNPAGYPLTMDTEPDVIDKLYDIETALNEKLDRLISTLQFSAIVLAMFMVLFLCFCLHG